ncbi:hypothetical protein [Xylocopilactobacillus apicola]|uniref:Uncharacterized protein n=1 Tax=Xylocopilactobacillus apicola TaxID=2932184 RepID=A0AAU9DVG8_9LACO|nr:hypothetical protein [Xylocopilactobacillus apicola]BDR57873.1 hypothetical protein XA3_03140 [Xylocopilactobacillus apicola]
MIKKIIKLSQKTDKVKYSIIIAYLFLVIPECVSMSLPHAGLIYNWVFRGLNIAGLLFFWVCSVLLGRLSGVTQGFGGYLVILSVLVEQFFSFLFGNQILFIVLFVLGTFWLIYDLLRAFLYSSTLARLDPKALGYNVWGNLVFFVTGFLLGLTPTVSLAYLNDTVRNARAALNFFYYFLHVISLAAIILSVLFYLYNFKKRVNRTTIWGNSFLIIASFIVAFSLYYFDHLVWSPLFYYMVALMLLGAVLVIPININKESLKNHDLAKEN